MPEFIWQIRVAKFHRDGQIIGEERWVALMDDGMVCNIHREWGRWEWKIGRVVGGWDAPYAAVRIGTAESIEQAKRQCEAAYRGLKAEYASV